MMLGADISDLSADTRSAASKGLSIVIPAYNEGAGLAQLHERIAALAAKQAKSAIDVAGEDLQELVDDAGAAHDVISPRRAAAARSVRRARRPADRCGPIGV